jgi:hypothetical protein
VLRERWGFDSTRKESRLAVLFCHVCRAFFFCASSHTTMHQAKVGMSVLR